MGVWVCGCVGVWVCVGVCGGCVGVCGGCVVCVNDSGGGTCNVKY